MGIARDALLIMELLAFGLFVAAIALENGVRRLFEGPQLIVLVIGAGVLVGVMSITGLLVE